MSYERGSNLLEYFMPLGSSALDLESVDASAAVHGEYVCVKRCKLKRFMFVVSVLVAADTTAPVVEANRRPTLGSSSGEVLIDQITIPDATAAGTVMYVDVDPVTFEVGDGLAFEHVTQAADAGTAAGDGYYGALFEDDPEVVGNESNMTESA